MIGLPITSNKECMRFRKFVNNCLQQHPHVAEPLIPKWRTFHEKDENDKIEACVLVMHPLISISLLAIDNEGIGVLMSKRGGVSHVGKCDVKSFEKFCGLVAIVSISRTQNDPCMGGTVGLVDVLYLNASSAATTFRDRSHLLADALKIVLPSRYSYASTPLSFLDEGTLVLPFNQSEQELELASS